MHNVMHFNVAGCIIIISSLVTTCNYKKFHKTDIIIICSSHLAAMC